MLPTTTSLIVFIESSGCSIQYVMLYAYSNNFTFPFWFKHILFLFIVWLLWLGLPILCWIEVVRVGILVFSQNLVRKLSPFCDLVLCQLWVCHKWLLLCWNMFPLYPLWWELFSWTGVKLYQIILLASIEMIV